MDTIKKLIEEIISFRDERDWKQFHNTKDLAIALSIEASELNEILLWKNNESIDKNKLSEELADVFIYAFLIAEKHDLDIKEIILEKLALNAEKYPINKSHGKADKYNEL
jgi:NTP pyrophosphatase (non-canonical NTP hydrolase)|tara:strand:+ start:105 stop:434 length:330 start_codon:yes stop_codon:yes gene_type:complete